MKTRDSYFLREEQIRDANFDPRTKANTTLVLGLDTFTRCEQTSLFGGWVFVSIGGVA